MPVNRGDPLVCVGLEQLRGDDLLDGQDDAIAASDTDRGATVLDSLDGILDLEVTAVGREDRVGQVVACAYRRLCSFGSAGVPARLEKHGRTSRGRLTIVIVYVGKLQMTGKRDVEILLARLSWSFVVSTGLLVLELQATGELRVAAGAALVARAPLATEFVSSATF